MLSLEELVQELINDGKGDIGRLEHILSTLKKGQSLYTSDQDYLEKLLAETRKSNDSIQSNEPKIAELHSESTLNENEPKDNLTQPTEIELLRKEIHKLQDKNHLIEEHLRKQPNQKMKKGQAVGGVILMAIGMVMVVGGGGMVIVSLCIGQPMYGNCRSDGLAFITGSVIFWVGMIPTVFGVRMIAKA